MTVQYGFDSYDPIDTAYSKSSTTAHGRGNFYSRYVTPSASGAHITASHMQAEWNAAADNGNARFMPVTEPPNGVNGSSSTGASDAASFCSALTTIYKGSSIYMPPSGSNEIWCFLAVDYFATLSGAYWDGWSNYIASYNFCGLGAVLYPCVYGDPTISSGEGAMCNTIGGQYGNGGAYCYCVWTYRPQDTAACGKFGATSYSGKRCSSSLVGVANATVQQIAQPSECGGDVDINYSNPSYTVTNYMFQIQHG